MTDEEEIAAAQVDSSGWMMMFGFGLVWTLACTCLFGLITLAAAGLIGTSASSEPPNVAMFGFMLAMFSPGPALLYAGGKELAALNHAKTLRAEFPGRPWKWTPQWTGGVIEANAATEAFWAWYGATAFALFLGPFLLQLTVVDPDWRVLILLPFVAIDLFFFRYAWRRTYSAQRYGSLGLKLSQLPLQLSQAFEVCLEIPANLEGLATLHLTCSRTLVTGRGKNQTTRSETVFETRTQVAIVASGAHSVIRGQLQMPEPQTGKNWRLEITAEELSESFELPVFAVQDPAHVERFAFGAEPS